ncbi:MAG: hypothetical protein O9253_01555, partial [Aquidulcibacter sp.]|nr:hypothetical protein [Aquidulcibacter sp.]
QCTDVDPSSAIPRPKQPHPTKPSAEIPIAPALNNKDSFSGHFRTPKGIRNPSRKALVWFRELGRRKRTLKGDPKRTWPPPAAWDMGHAILDVP